MKYFLLIVTLIFSTSLFAEKYIEIDKKTLTLRLREDDKILQEHPVCLAIKYGPKKRRGDHKTPEGTYKINMIQPSSGWTHDFHDGKGQRRGAYGPWFFRLDFPYSDKIGIHGTCFPESMGKRESDGCIRMINEELEMLHPHVFKGMKVVILPDVISDPTPATTVFRLFASAAKPS